MGFGVSAILARLGLQHIRATSGVLVSLAVGTVATMAIAFLVHTREILDLAVVALAWFLLAGILNFPMGRLLSFTSIRSIGAARSSSIIAASPLVATALAVTVGTETLSVAILLGTFAIVGGLAIILSQQ